MSTQDNPRAAFEAWSNDKKSRKEGYDAFDIWQAAIEHDRKEWGEPVGMLSLSGNYANYIKPESEVTTDDYDFVFFLPDDQYRDGMYLYTAPQPAEPVKVPELVVTKGGVPFEDQNEGIRQFKEACMRAADDEAKLKATEPVKCGNAYKDNADFHVRASLHELGAWQRGWDECKAMLESESAKVVSDSEIMELSDEFVGLEPLSDFDYVGFARAILVHYGQPAESAEPAAWLVPSILSFKCALRTDCPEEAREDLEGTVVWQPSDVGDRPPVTDKFGVEHRPIPLVLADNNLNAKVRNITLPDGTVRHNVGSDNLSDEDRAAMGEDLLAFLRSDEAKDSNVYINGEWAYLDKAKLVKAALRHFAPSADEKYRRAYQEWSDKTEFIQDWINQGKLSGKYLGMHRADIMRDLIEQKATPNCADDILDLMPTQAELDRESLMRCIVKAGQDAGIIRDDLETASVSECLHILDCLSKPNPGILAAWRDVARERQRQLEVEGWSYAHDNDEHDPGELAAAAASYALNAADQLNPYSQGDNGNEQPDMWPWSAGWWKPTTPRRDLVKAGALILAEIERLDRMGAQT